jgi:TolB-like protein
MKNIFAAFMLAIILTGVSLAQSGKPRIAVVEFKDATGIMSYEAKRHLQASIAFEMVKKRDFDVPDVRNTRAATPTGDIGGAAAVKIGKQMNVSYVLIGTVTEYSTTAGKMGVRTQLVNVANGKVVLSGETTGETARPMTPNAGHAEMSSKVVKPLIQKLFAELVAANL